MSRRPHPTVTVEVGDRCADIDILIAPLIEAMWKAGINTMMSCQEAEPGTVWIEFDGLTDLRNFLDRVVWFEDDEGSLYARANWWRFPDASNSWRYELELVDFFEGQSEQTEDGDACFDFWVSLYFPQSDISELVSRLQNIASAKSPRYDTSAH